MIVSFGNKETEKVWLGERIKKLPNEVQEVGQTQIKDVEQLSKHYGFNHSTVKQVGKAERQP